MKKLFVIFTVCFLCAICTPKHAYSIEMSFSSDLTLDSNGYAYKDDCKVVSSQCDDSDDCLHIGRTNTCYIADDDGSEKFCEMHGVCVLGTTVDRKWARTYTNACLGSYVFQGDDKWVFNKQTIQDCPNYPNNSTTKQPAFLTNSNKILTDKDGKVAKSIVSAKGNKVTFMPVSVLKRQFELVLYDYNIKCVAYICINSDGKYTEPCDDGTCSANCNNAGGGADDNSGGSAPGGNDGGNDGGENGGNANAKEPDDNKIHRHTVDPWLNALDAYRATCKK